MAVRERRIGRQAERPRALSQLTELDALAIDIARELANLLESAIPTADSEPLFAQEFPRSSASEQFRQQYGRVAYSRSAGLGRGAAKLQRDALTTRGQGNKTPYSNRNFRWHPFVLAHECPPYSESIDEILVEVGQPPVFRVNGIDYEFSETWTWDTVYCAAPDKWQPADVLARIPWQDYKCAIPAKEFSTRPLSVASFGSLGLGIAIGRFGADPAVYEHVVEYLEGRLAEIGEAEEVAEALGELPGVEELSFCPLCKARLDEGPASLDREERPLVFQRPWERSKRAEGEDSAIQILHIAPLVESEIRHRPANVRYGHRWCNVMMSDQTLDRTLRFMDLVLKAHS